MTTLTTARRWTSTMSFLPAKVPGNTCIPGVSTKLPKQDFQSGALRKMLSCLTLQCDAWLHLGQALNATMLLTPTDQCESNLIRACPAKTDPKRTFHQDQGINLRVGKTFVLRAAFCAGQRCNKVATCTACVHCYWQSSCQIKVSPFIRHGAA